jgi:hypothetical protein
MPGELTNAPSVRIVMLGGAPWQSVPGSVKPTYLAQHGYEVANSKLPDEDFEAAVRIAPAEFDKHQPAAVVGSYRHISCSWPVS